MPIYLAITNERNDFIFDCFLDQSPDRILPPLLAYAALDCSVIQEYEGYKLKLHTTVAGHKLILITKKTNLNANKFIIAVENILQQELLSPYVNDQIGLEGNFKKKVLEIYDSQK